MSESEALFALLRQSADPAAAAAVERLVREGQDRELSRVNAIRFDGRSIYHGVTFRLNRRLDDNLAYNVSYTLSQSKVCCRSKATWQTCRTSRKTAR